MRNFQGEFWAGTKILLMDSTNRTPVLIIVYVMHVRKGDFCLVHLCLYHKICLLNVYSD